ncbi:MAG TPA: YceI family protein [Myxococcales bacterium]|nr:YceI family protein [Myxococcales bacterium]
MKAALLFALLAAFPARAERSWQVEPGQALVTVDGPAFSAFSHGVTGTLTELDDGLVRLELRLPIASLTTGDASHDRRAVRRGEAVFEGVARGGGDTLHFVGTLGLHGVSRPLILDVAVFRTPASLIAHASTVLRLRDYGVDLKADAARIELDARLRRPGVVAASRG